jgi:hypothetical protein
MAEQYPFVLANSRLGSLLEAIEAAARPPKFTGEFLRSLGFSSSNDRAFIPLFRRLGFIEENGSPTEAYDRLRDKQLRPQVLAEKIRESYADLFSINTNIQDSSDEDLRGAISRVTGKDAATVQRYANTFKALAALANFKAPAGAAIPKVLEPPPAPAPPPPPPPLARQDRAAAEFHYNIQIHLPATSDVSVYNAIFRALKENLGL